MRNPGKHLHPTGFVLFAAGLVFAAGCGSDNAPRVPEDTGNKKSAQGLSPVPADAPLVGDNFAPNWFGVGATGPVSVHVFYPANPILTLWSGDLKAGEKVRVGRRKPVVVEYSNGTNLYFSLGDRVETATKARFGKDPIP